MYVIMRTKIYTSFERYRCVHTIAHDVNVIRVSFTYDYVTPVNNIPCVLGAYKYQGMRVLPV